MKVVCCTALLLGLLISPALAGTITVTIDPVSQYVPFSNGIAQVDILATIAEEDRNLRLGYRSEPQQCERLVHVRGCRD